MSIEEDTLEGTIAMLGRLAQGDLDVVAVNAPPAAALEPLDGEKKKGLEHLQRGDIAGAHVQRMLEAHQKQLENCLRTVGRLMLFLRNHQPVGDAQEPKDPQPIAVARATSGGTVLAWGKGKVTEKPHRKASTENMPVVGLKAHKERIEKIQQSQQAARNLGGESGGIRQKPMALQEPTKPQGDGSETGPTDTEATSAFAAPLSPAGLHPDLLTLPGGAKLEAELHEEKSGQVEVSHQITESSTTSAEVHKPQEKEETTKPAIVEASEIQLAPVEKQPKPKLSFHENVRRLSFATRRGSQSTLASGTSAIQARSEEQHLFTSDIAQVMKSMLRDETSVDGSDAPQRWRRLTRDNTAGTFFIRVADHAVNMVKGHSHDRHALWAIYGVICGLVILLDAIVIGIETDYIAKTGDTNTTFKALSYIFNSWYAVEIIVRFYTRANWKDFFTGHDYLWNWFDLALIMAALADFIIDLAFTETLSIGRVFRTIRLLRAVRVLRLVRWLQILREFQKLLLCLASSLMTLLCSLALLAFTVFVFGIFFTQSLPIYIESRVVSASRATWTDEEMEKAFGSVSKSMVSLFQAVTAGRNWGELSTMLEEIHPFLFMVFLMFMAIVMFGLLNVVTAVFVESAMRATQHYRDLLVHEKLMRERISVQHLKEIFKAIDIDNSGAISLEEMESFLSDDTLKLQEYFEALELNASDTQTLFHLLDRDGSGEVDIDEFCDGCMRLGGNAKSFDINCMWYEIKRSHRDMLKLVQKMFMGLHTLTRVQASTKDRIHGVQKQITEHFAQNSPQSPRSEGRLSRRHSRASRIEVNSFMDENEEGNTSDFLHESQDEPPSPLRALAGTSTAPEELEAPTGHNSRKGSVQAPETGQMQVTFPEDAPPPLPNVIHRDDSESFDGSNGDDNDV